MERLTSIGIFAGCLAGCLVGTLTGLYIADHTPKPPQVSPADELWNHCMPKRGEVMNLMITETGIECAVLKKGRLQRRYQS